MAVKDTTPLRPSYLSATLFRDYQYTVYNEAGEPVLYLVTFVGENRSFYVKDVIKNVHKIVRENRSEIARICLARYTRESTDLINTLKRYHNPPGQYGMSVVDVDGGRLYTFEFTLDYGD